MTVERGGPFGVALWQVFLEEAISATVSKALCHIHLGGWCNGIVLDNLGCRVPWTYLLGTGRPYIRQVDTHSWAVSDDAYFLYPSVSGRICQSVGDVFGTYYWF